MENEERDSVSGSNPIDNSFNQRPPYNFPDRAHNHWLGGLVVIVAGFVLLFNRLPQTAKYFPDWLFDWPMILIVIGVFVGAKHRFRAGIGWLVPVFIGVYFLLQDNNLIKEEWNVYALPLLLILAGFFLIIKRNTGRCGGNKRRDMFYERMKRRQEFWQNSRRAHFDKQPQFTDNSSEDYVDINSVFGHAKKNMFTKDFKGGNISCSFGGGELNLSQADIAQAAVLNLSITFGGAEIIVPANWSVQNELSAFMGGIDDKRRAAVPASQGKTLVLRGNIFCGSVEIKN